MVNDANKPSMQPIDKKLAANIRTLIETMVSSMYSKLGGYFVVPVDGIKVNP